MKEGHIKMECVALRQKLHEIPEKSFGEEQTKKTLQDWMREYTDSEVVDRGSWFFAVKKGGSRPPVAFRADMDAVAGADGRVGHYCGHDGHSAILAGLAESLTGKTPPQDIYMIFQPAEEIGKGAALCRDLLREKQIDCIYGLHNIPGYPKGTVLLKKGTFACGSTGLKIRMQGTPSHAAYPENGRNPGMALAKLLLFAQCRAEEVQKEYFLLMTVIGVTIGSSAYGVSASDGEIRMTIRAEKERIFRDYLTDIKAEASRLAEEGGFSLETEEIEYFPATENHDAQVEKLRTTAQALQMPTVKLQNPMRWSEDFGYYLQECKGAFFGIGDGENYPQLHTSAFSFPDDILPGAVKLLYTLAMEQ